jgi:hypothetical protein
MRILLCYCLFFILLALMSCRTEEETPPASPVPAIAFKSLTRFPSNPSMRYQGDSVHIAVTYADGDSDLGFRQDDVYALEDQYRNGVLDKKSLYNYYLELEKKHNGVFRPVVFQNPDFTLWGRFPRTSDGNVTAATNPFIIQTHSPWRGEIVFKFKMIYEAFPDLHYVNPYQPGDTLKYRVQVADRAMNVSNTVETPEFVFMK